MPDTPDQTALLNRIADIATPFLANFSDEEAAKVNAKELAAAVMAVLPEQTDRDAEAPAAECSAQNRNYESGPRLCIRAAQHHGDHIDGRGFHWSDTVAVYPVSDGTFRRGTDVRALLRRVAAEEQPTETVLPGPVERAAILRQEADQIRAHCPDHLDSDSTPGAWMVCHCDVADDMMRRLAGAPQPETEAGPRRGDAVEQWLKAQRDAAVDYPEAYQAADGLLDLYRLHADTGTPLGEHVCEGRAVGDCHCLEQPAKRPPMDPVHILGIGAAPEQAVDEQPRITSDGGGVLLHLPEIVYIDTQAWAVDIGLTTDALRALRDAATAYLAGEQPAETKTQEPQKPPTEADIARAHVLAVHQIGEQLADIETWMWEHLANVRNAAPEQPAVGEQPTTCTATIPAVINSAPDRCVAPAGHYDESNEPVFTGDVRSPGGWHTNGQGHVWSDRAAAATPHNAQPEPQEMP